MEVLSTEPQFQFYTGKYIETKARADGTPAFGKRAGIAIEPCRSDLVHWKKVDKSWDLICVRFTNAVNVPEWRDMVVLKKGDTYGRYVKNPFQMMVSFIDLGFVL